MSLHCGARTCDQGSGVKRVLRAPNAHPPTINNVLAIKLQLSRLTSIFIRNKSQEKECRSKLPNFFDVDCTFRTLLGPGDNHIKTGVCSLGQPVKVKAAYQIDVGAYRSNTTRHL